MLNATLICRLRRVAPVLLAMVVLLGPLGAAVAALQPTKAIAYLKKNAAALAGKVDDDNVSIAFRQAITNKSVDDDFKNMIEMVKNEADPQSYDQLANDLKDHLREALNNTKLGPNWPDLGQEIDTFVDLLATVRNLKQAGKINDDVYRRGMTGMFEVIRAGGDYRTARNLLTNICNMVPESADYTRRVTNAMNLFDDMGAMVKESERNGGTAVDQLRVWLRAAGRKPLSRSDRQWFGLLGEIKLGRQLREMGVEILEINSRLDGKLAADFLVKINGEKVAFEVKNIDLTQLDPSLIAQRARTLVKQVERHGRQVGDETGKRVAVVFTGSDPSGAFAETVERMARDLGLSAFSRNQVQFLGARQGDAWDDALQNVLEIGKNDPSAVRAIIQEALDATQ